MFHNLKRNVLFNRPFAPKKYLPELAKIQYKGVIGDVAFEPTGDIKNGTITLYQVKSGKWELVKK